MKTALITGVTGQDGSYLTETLLRKGYRVHGIRRRGSTTTTGRLDEAVHDETRFNLHYGDLTDAGSLNRAINTVEPDEIYNLGAQSDVAVSFRQPEYTAEVNGLGLVRLLEAVRESDCEARVYQASTSELFGEAEKPPQDESTSFCPANPYGTSKLYSYWIACNYRDAYDQFVSNGILFNHESPRRGREFVSRKITTGVAEMEAGRENPIELGNLDARRDWGFAPEYVDAMWRMLQQSEPDDYVVATGESHSVRAFVSRAFESVGRDIRWDGNGLNERGYLAENGDLAVTVNQEYFRPNDVNDLIGDAGKAREKLGWEAETTFEELVDIMVQADVERLDVHS